VIARVRDVRRIALALRRMAVLALSALAACGQRPTRAEVRIAEDSVVLAGTLFLPTTPGAHPGVVIVHGWPVSGGPGGGKSRSADAEETIRQRYARGEIDRETFIRMRDDLQRQPPD